VNKGNNVQAEGCRCQVSAWVDGCNVFREEVFCEADILEHKVWNIQACAHSRLPCILPLTFFKIAPFSSIGCSIVMLETFRLGLTLQSTHQEDRVMVGFAWNHRQRTSFFFAWNLSSTPVRALGGQLGNHQPDAGAWCSNQ
jgi:hypothetical protein